MKSILPIACLVFLFSSSTNATGVLRCKGKIIDVGVPAAYVLSKCGAPDGQVVQEALARAGTVSGFARPTGIAVSEQWVYERGWGKFPVVLSFFDGTLRRISFLPDRS